MLTFIFLLQIYFISMLQMILRIFSRSQKLEKKLGFFFQIVFSLWIFIFYSPVLNETVECSETVLDALRKMKRENGSRDTGTSTRDRKVYAWIKQSSSAPPPWISRGRIHEHKRTFVRKDFDVKFVGVLFWYSWSIS